MDAVCQLKRLLEYITRVSPRSPPLIHASQVVVIVILTATVI